MAMRETPDNGLNTLTVFSLFVDIRFVDIRFVNIRPRNPFTDG
jgi:hypothetical protein